MLVERLFFESISTVKLEASLWHKHFMRVFETGTVLLGMRSHHRHWPVWLFHCSKYLGEITSENYFVILNVFLCCISHPPPSSSLAFSYLDSRPSPPSANVSFSSHFSFWFSSSQMKTVSPWTTVYMYVHPSTTKVFHFRSQLKLMLICHHHLPLLPILAMSIPANKAQVLIHSCWYCLITRLLLPCQPPLLQVGI